MISLKIWKAFRPRVGCALLLGLFPLQSWALTNFVPSNVSSFNAGSVEILVKTSALGTAHHAYQPPSPLGIVIGVDVGVEVTALQVPSDFAAILATAAGVPTSQIPNLVAIPRLNLHKGLPKGFDVGVSWMGGGWIGYADQLNVLGFDLKWTLPTRSFKSGKPTIAVRADFSTTRLWFIESIDFELETLASWNLPLLEPYLGFGVHFWSGNLVNLPTGASGLLAGVPSSASGASPSVLLGTPLRLGLLHLTTELSYVIGGPLTWGGKVSFSF